MRSDCWNRIFNANFGDFIRDSTFKDFLQHSLGIFSVTALFVCDHKSMQKLKVSLKDNINTFFNYIGTLNRLFPNVYVLYGIFFICYDTAAYRSFSNILDK